MSWPARQPHLRYLLWLALSLLALSAAGASAGVQGQSGLSLVATAGYDGYYKADFWVPVQINVSNSGPAVEGTLRVITGLDSAGNAVNYDSPISLPTRSRKRLTTYVRLAEIRTELAVQLLDGEGRLLLSAGSNTLRRLEATTLLYAVASPEPDELEFLEDIPGGFNDAAVAFVDLEELPPLAVAWTAMDVLVLNNVDSGRLSSEQRSALEQWLQVGGQLVVTGGPGWQQTTTALAGLLPVNVSGVQSVGDLPALAAYAGIPFRDPGPYVVATSSLRQGELLLHQDGLPLLARQRQGRGAVIFLALDPALAPLQDWDGSQRLWSEIAAAVPVPPYWSLGARNGYAAANAVESLPTLALPSPWLLALFLLLYLLAAGPANYLLLRRLGRRELAWLTIPAIVVLFSGLAYGIGLQVKGNDVIVNQLGIGFGQVGASTVRMQSVVGIYSPRRASYNLILPASELVRPFERGRGGLRGAGDLGSVVRGADVEVRDLQVDVSGVQALVIDSFRPMPAVTGRAALDLDGSDVTLSLSVENGSEFTLENATALLGSTSLPLGNVEAGGQVKAAQSLSAGEASALMATLPGSPPAPTPAGDSVLRANYGLLLGNGDFYSDPALRGRWQLLESLTPDFGGVPAPLPAGTVTLIFWISGSPPAEVALAKERFKPQNNAVYFLELPLEQELSEQQDVAVPLSMLNVTVLADSGLMEPKADDLYLTGWIELEFKPWPTFREMRVDRLELALSPGEETVGDAPTVQLWNWQTEMWQEVAQVEWGTSNVPAFTPFVGPANAVRLRLQSRPDSRPVHILSVYPRLIGDLP